MCYDFGLGIILISSLPQPLAPQGRFYYWRLVQEACAGHLDINPLLTMNPWRVRAGGAQGAEPQGMDGHWGPEGGRTGLSLIVSSRQAPHFFHLPHCQLYSFAGEFLGFGGA